MESIGFRASSVFTTMFNKNSPKMKGAVRIQTASSSSRVKAKKEKVIVIAGPTCVGKTRLALELARRLGGEIISADSMQVYKGLDIGTAKTQICDRQDVPHHLLDILHPTEEYSAGKYFDDAREATANVLDKGHVPIVVGGTGLYLRWYLYGKPNVPKASYEIATEVDSELAMLQSKGDWDAAVQLLLKAGDSSACDLNRNDWYRLCRGLEIMKASGIPRTSFPVPYDSLKGQGASRISVSSSDVTHAEDETMQGFFKELDYDFLCFFLSVERIDLYRQIDHRCEEMLTGSGGLLAEASWLLDLGILPNTSCASRAIGYRQAMEYLLRCREAGGASSEKEFYAFLSDFQKASRNFAKRQYTWFRNEPLYQWLDASQPLEKLVESIVNKCLDSADVSIHKSLIANKNNSSRAIKKLNAYQPQNRHFVKSTDCTHIIEWIKLTQSGRDTLFRRILMTAWRAIFIIKGRWEALKISMAK
eukprot:Gb_23529 [translate_table: standard]